MSNPEFLSYTSNLAPGIFQGRRKTWISIGVGLLVLLGLMIWAAVSLMGWLWGQTQSIAGTAPTALQGAARGVLEQVSAFVPGARDMINQAKERVPDARGALDQVTQSVPGARQILDGIVPSLKTEPTVQRDVSGEDLGPVARQAGFMRTQWLRTGGLAAVEYEGKADYVNVLDYYAKGFAAQGFAQKVQSATPEAETHEYAKGAERFALKIAQKSRGLVSIRIEMPQQ